MIAHSLQPQPFVPVACETCSAILPPHRLGTWCIGCGVRVAGLSIEVEPPMVFIGGEHPAHLTVVLQNDGQVTTPVSSVVLISAGEEVELHGTFYEGIAGGGRHEIEYELPEEIASGRSRIEVRSEAGLVEKTEVQLLPIPTLEVVSSESLSGEPVVTLSQENEVEAKSAQDWTSPLQIRVTGSSGEHIEITSLDIQAFGQTFTALGDDRSLKGMRTFESQIKVDGYEADKTQGSPVQGTVTLRVKGYPHAVTQAFRISRSRRSRLQVYKKDLLRELASQAGSDGRNKVLHGLGRLIPTTIGLRNDGDLEVEIAGPITSTSPALRIYNESEHTGITIPKGEPGLRYSVALQPDEVAFESLPAFGGEDSSGASDTRRLLLELEVPIREVGADGGQVRRELVTVTDVIVRQVSPDPNYALFVDFGTTNTCVAHVRPGAQHPEMLDVDETDELGNLYPSLVEYLDLRTKPYDCSFGEFVRDKSRVDTGAFLATASEFKPYISDEGREFYYTDKKGHTERVPARSSAVTFLTYAFDELKRLKLEAIPTQILLSYPVSFNERDKETLKSVVEEAFGHQEQVTVETLQSEPSALLADLLLGDTGMEPVIGESKVIGVFDFGGGTTDILLTRAKRLGHTDYELEHLGRDVAEQGGEQLTRQIARAIWPDIKAQILKRGDTDASHEVTLDTFNPPLDPTKITTLSEAHQELYKTLIGQADRVKMAYTQLRRSQKGDVTGVSSFGGGGYKVVSDATGTAVNCEATDPDAFADGKVVNDAIDEFVQPMLEKLYRLEYEKIQKQDPDSQIDIILLAGNSSRLERVQELARYIFDRDRDGEPSRVHFAGEGHAKEGVVKGLAYWSLCPPDEIVRAEEDATPFKLKLPDGDLSCGEPGRGKFIRSKLIPVHETDAIGEPKPDPYGLFDLREVLKKTFERLTLILRIEEGQPVLDVHEHTADGEPLGELRATLQPKR